MNGCWSRCVVGSARNEVPRDRVADRERGEEGDHALCVVLMSVLPLSLVLFVALFFDVRRGAVALCALASDCVSRRAQSVDLSMLFYRTRADG